MFLARGEAVELDGLRFVGLGEGVEFLAYGVAAEDYLLGGEKAFHAVVGHTDALHLLGEHLVGEAGESVLLLDQAGHLLGRCLAQQGSAGESAHADGDIGLELVYEFCRHALALEHQEGNLYIINDVAPVQLPLQALDGQADDLVTGCGHLLHFHLAFRSHEEDLGLGI